MGDQPEPERQAVKRHTPLDKPVQVRRRPRRRPEPDLQAAKRRVALLFRRKEEEFRRTATSEDEVLESPQEGEMREAGEDEVLESPQEGEMREAGEDEVLESPQEGEMREAGEGHGEPDHEDGAEDPLRKARREIYRLKSIKL